MYQFVLYVMQSIKKINIFSHEYFYEAIRKYLLFVNEFPFFLLMIRITVFNHQ